MFATKIQYLSADVWRPSLAIIREEQIAGTKYLLVVLTPLCLSRRLLANQKNCQETHRFQQVYRLYAKGYLKRPPSLRSVH
jgi:hypothetical protein